jgi:hypothetical protein
MNIHPIAIRRCLLLSFAALIVLGLVEFAVYPGLSWQINRTLGNGQPPGSSMGYFRDVYVGRGLLVFGLIAIAGLAVAAKRSDRALHIAFGALLLLNGVLLVSSALWYYRAIADAAGATSRP